MVVVLLLVVMVLLLLVVVLVLLLVLVLVLVQAGPGSSVASTRSDTSALPSRPPEFLELASAPSVAPAPISTNSASSCRWGASPAPAATAAAADARYSASVGAKGALVKLMLCKSETG
jgi:hypothetical protein